MEGQAQVNGVELWYQVSGEGEPVVQIHGAGFGHFNFAPATPELAEALPGDRLRPARLRAVGPAGAALRHGGLGGRRRRACSTRSRSTPAHVHGTSMGGMIAIVFAGKYPERTTSVVINCAAAKLGMAGRLVFKNWIDIARMDPDGPGSRILAELIAWQALSKAFLETPDGVAAIDNDPADPARLEPDRGVHGRLPGDVRHGHPRLAAEDHLARARSRRRRGPDDAVGPGARTAPASRRSTRGSPAPRSTSSTARTTRRSSTTPTSTTGS